MLPKTADRVEQDCSKYSPAVKKGGLMGKQKAHKRRIAQERRAKEELKNGQSLGVLPIIENKPAQTSLAVVAPTPVVPAPTVAPAATATTPAETKPQFPRGERRPGDTVAGQTKYDRYFGLFARAVREGKTNGFRSLGFIPGPAAVLEFEANKVRVVGATPEEVQLLGTVPTSWMTWEEVPDQIRKPLEAYQLAVATLDHHPSPYHKGSAKRLLAGNLPPQHLTMLMGNFRYKAGDPERPFGVVLVPTENGVRVAKTYNPGNVAEVPAEGTILTLDQIKNGFGAIQKLLRTWALMEENYTMRYDEQGNRLANGGYRPPQQQRQPVTTATN